jgi:lipopolysaccharide biosynthesis glycosyltransferase
MTIIPILFTFDQALEMPAGVCICSLLDNAAPDTFYDIFILHGPRCDFSNSLIGEIPQHYGNCRITFRKIDGEFVGGYVIRNIPETAYYRLIAPEVIPEYDKILYSDVDVIFREDLSDYYSKDLGDNYFGAVETCSRIRPEIREYVSGKLNLDWEKGYYYSGNLLINSGLLLKDGILDLFREHGKNAFSQQDMDIINITCNGRFLSLGPSFCLTVQLYDLIVNRRQDMVAMYGKDEITHALKSGIVHYNGSKPWRECCPNMDIWWSSYRKSVFYDEAFAYDFWKKQRDLLENLSLLKRLKILLRYPIDKRKR